MPKITCYSKTQIIQKRAMRTIYNKRYNSRTNPPFNESGILKISDRYQLEVMTFMHDHIHGKLPISFYNTYNINYQIHGVHETRQAYMFYVPRTKSRFVDNVPLFQFPTIWNNWYSQMNVNSSRNAMRLHVKSIYLSIYSAAVKCNNTLFVSIVIPYHSVLKQSCSLYCPLCPSCYIFQYAVTGGVFA